MQLVLSGNRIIAHGENFLCMGGTVINTETGKVYQNATVTECNGCPSDIDEVGYEYHAGQFVPCAPYGESATGHLMVSCPDCATPRRSKVTTADILLLDTFPAANFEQSSEYRRNIAYADGIYVACEHAVYPEISTNGVEWTAISNAPAQFSHIAVGGGLIVGCYGKQVYVSSDNGVTWETIPIAKSVSGICYGNGMFLLWASDSVYKDTYFYTSADGVTWQSGETFSDDKAAIDTITFINGKFIAFTYEYYTNYYCIKRFESADGVSWTHTDTLAQVIEPYIASGNGTEVVVAINYPSAKNEGSVIICGDEKIYDAGTEYTDIAYGNGRFVVVGATEYMYSENGTEWTKGTFPDGHSAYTVLFDGEKFIAPGLYYIAYSTDGKRWTLGGIELVNGLGEIKTEEVMAAVGSSATSTAVYDELATAYSEGVNEA